MYIEYYVFVEISNHTPFAIRRIEELNKTSLGNVEAKVMCFYRRRDLPNPLVQLADKHQMASAEDSPLAMKIKKTWLRTPVGEEQAAQAVLDPSIASLDEERLSSNSPNSEKSGNGENLTPKQRHQVKHRELFLSRQVEVIPANNIRGKCSVTLLNETESLTSYLNKDDTFFYCLVFDPNQKTLLADKGEIRVGSRYQTDIPAMLSRDEKTDLVIADDRKLEDLESIIWTPHHSLTDRQIDQFLVVSRSIGTFARALDCSSSVKQPSLHMSAAAASRDITLFNAMDILHNHTYSIEESLCSLVPSTGPMLCRDEIEDWSASEANLFEEALDKYGKDFNDIRQDFLPWKTLKQIVEYYYMWKTTDRYVQQKRVKAVDAESKLKQVYIPNYTGGKNSTTITSSKGGASISLFNGTSNGTDLTNGKPCESCSSTNSTNSQWYPWGPAHISCRLCHNCWNYWKKYGGLKQQTRLGDAVGVEPESSTPTPTATPANNKKKFSNDVILEEEKSNDLSNPRQNHKCSIVSCGKEFKLKSHLARHYAQAHGLAVRSGSPRPIMKTRTAFYMHANIMTRLSRILCRHLIKSKKAARQPSFVINTHLVRQEFILNLSGKNPTELKNILIYKKKQRGSVTKIANKLGSPGSGPHEWLVLTPKDKLPKPERIAFPKPPKAPDGSLVYERVPNKCIDFSVKEPDVTILPNTTITTIGSTAISTQVTNLSTSSSSSGSSSIRKRPHEDINGSENAVQSFVGPPTKRPNKDPMPSHCPSPEQFAAMMAAAGQPIPRHHLNGKPKIAHMARTGSGRKQVISWMDAPDDVYFRSTPASRKARNKMLSTSNLRRAARKPWKNLPVKSPPPIIPSTPSDLQVVILD
ncbi:MTA1 family protein [Megaselia abdita]